MMRGAASLTIRSLARASSSTAAPRKLPPLSSSPLVHEYDRLLRDGALRPARCLALSPGHHQR